MSCCGIPETVARIKADAVGNPIINEDDFVMVKYIGGNRQKHRVHSPSRVLQREYGFRANHYGQHANGDEFAIHRNDLKKAPKLFKEVKAKVEKAEADKTPAKPEDDTTDKAPATPDDKPADAKPSGKDEKAATDKAPAKPADKK